MAESRPSAGTPGLAIEAVEWLPSGADSGLVRVRGRWADPSAEPELPALGLRRGDETHRFDSLPDARYGRDPAVWRGTYLVPAALMDPAPDELWLAWDKGVRMVLPAPAAGFEPPPAPVRPAPPEPRGEVIDRAVLAERRARRAEAAEREQARRAADAIAAVEVLELRSAELERRLAALQAEGAAEAAAVAPEAPDAAPAVAKAPDAATDEAAAAVAPETDAVPAAPAAVEEALQEALATIKRQRAELDEQRQRLRRSELLRGADAVALASLRADQDRARRLQDELAASERELVQALANADARAAEVVAAQAELAALRSERAAAGRALDSERSAHAETRKRLATRERELAAIGNELAAVRTELTAVRDHAAQRAAQLEQRLTELEAALAAERRAHGIAARDQAAARAAAAQAESARNAESVARAALDDELDRERAARAALSEALAAAQAAVRAAQVTEADIVLSREQVRAEAAAAQAKLEQAVSVEETLRAELAAERARADSAEASVRELRTAIDAAHARIAGLEREQAAARADGGFTARIAEIERAADGDLDRRARMQEEAAATAARQPAADQHDLSASLDAAAAALRAAAEPAPEATEPAAPAPSAPSDIAFPKREYPRLRSAVVRLARDDPRAATRLVLGLVPVQRALIDPPLEYDLTIRDWGTYAISVTERGAGARAVSAPRPRREAAFHVAADVATIAEVLAGVEKRIGRWFGSVRIHGPRGRAQDLRARLTRANLDLPAAARAGADLDPDLVFRLFAYAIDPAWTKGHSFVVAQEIAGPRPMRWHIAARDGAPVVVERRPPPNPPDAVVSMSRVAFTHLLRDEPAPSGERPAIRGDREAVALLKAWTDRAQGRAG